MSVNLWASRQNGLLMRWLIVAYALCTTLADHPDTQSDSTNYASLPEVRSQGQGRGSAANGLLNWTDLITGVGLPKVILQYHRNNNNKKNSHHHSKTNSIVHTMV